MVLKKHQKYLLQGLFITAVILVLFCLFILRLSIAVTLLTLLLVGFFGIAVLWQNKRLKKQLNPNVYPDNDWYREHLERNYDYLVLGEEKNQAKFEGKVFDMSLPGQTIKWDFMILKQYYSILKPQGKVVFVCTSNSLWKGWNDVNDLRPYYMCMRPYVFTNNKLKQLYIKTARRLPVIMFRLKDIFGVHRSLSVFSENESKTIDLMKSIVSFCKDREIVPYILIRDTFDSETLNKIEATGLLIINK